MAEVSALIEGGKATAGAPLGPALGPLGVNIGEIVAKINEKTKSYAGMKVPITLEIHKDKTYDIIVGSPPTSALILKELNIQKGGAHQKADTVGNLTMEQVKKLADMKLEALTSTNVKKASREIIGTCNSMSITIEGLRAGEMQKEFDAGKWDSYFEGGAKPQAVKEDLEKLGSEAKETVGNIVEEVKEVVETVVEKVQDVIESVTETVREEVHEATAPPEEKAEKEEAKEEPKEEVKEEPVQKVEEPQSEEKIDAQAEALEEEIKEEPKVKKESYSQHMMKMEKESGVSKGLDISITEEKPKKHIETEVVKDDGKTEITRPKKKE